MFSDALKETIFAKQKHLFFMKTGLFLITGGRYLHFYGIRNYQNNIFGNKSSILEKTYCHFCIRLRI